LKVLFVSSPARIGRFLSLFELRIGARPVFLPPGLEFVRRIGLAIGTQNAGSCAERGDQRPVAVLPQPETAEMFTQQKDDPQFGTMLLVVLERLGLAERNGIKGFDNRGVVRASISPCSFSNPFDDIRQFELRNRRRCLYPAMLRTGDREP